MKPKPLTIIIAEHNEGQQLNDTIDNILDTADDKLFDIIVVSDFSNEVQPDLSRYGSLVRHVRNTMRLGVGASFDVGALHVETPHMIVMGSDIRFKQTDYVDKMIGHIEDSPDALICTVNVGINNQRMDMDHPKVTRRYGARILFFMKAEDLPSKSKFRNDPLFKNVLEAKWITKQQGRICELPCILGAFYGVSKSWYDHIKGFMGHRYWGTLEPFISLKSWFAGGKCMIANDVENGHIFKQRPSHITHTHDLMYNKLMAAEVLFPNDIKHKLISFLGRNEHIDRAKRMILDDQAQIDHLKKYYQQIFKRDIHWFYDKFPFKYYDSIILEE